MPRTISADGRTIVVPDDATDEEINQIVGPAPGASTPKPLGLVDKVRNVMLHGSTGPAQPGTREYAAEHGQTFDFPPWVYGASALAGGAEALPGIIKMAPKVGPALSAAFKAGGPSVAKGAAKVGVGAALDASGVPAHVGTLLGAREGIPDIAEGIKSGYQAAKSVPAPLGPGQRLAKAIEMPAREARPPLPAPHPTGLTGTEGISSGPLAPVKPLNIAGPMPPPAEGGFMPKPAEPPLKPALVSSNRPAPLGGVTIPRPDAETLVEEAGGGGLQKPVRQEVRGRVQKSNLKENQKALEEFRAREAKRKQ